MDNIRPETFVMVKHPIFLAASQHEPQLLQTAMAILEEISNGIAVCTLSPAERVPAD